MKIKKITECTRVPVNGNGTHLCSINIEKGEMDFWFSVCPGNITYSFSHISDFTIFCTLSLLKKNLGKNAK
jgi:hypothetical protein